MKDRLIVIGIISSLFLIVIQLVTVFFELSQLSNRFINLALNSLNSFFNITVLIVLWKLLVGYYNQLQLDWIIKSIILLHFLIAGLSIVIGFKVSMLALTSVLGLSLINLILYFIFLIRIANIEEHEIQQINPLKNYSLAFIISLFGQFVLTIFFELKFFSHFLIIIPFMFLTIFFVKIRNEVRLASQNEI